MLVGGAIGLGLAIAPARRKAEANNGSFISNWCPGKAVFSGEVEQVDVPGAEGDFGVLAGHAPFVTTLRPGILTVHGAGGAQKIVVLGGFAEVSAQGLTVLADVAEAVEDIDRGVIASASASWKAASRRSSPAPSSTD